MTHILKLNLCLSSFRTVLKEERTTSDDRCSCVSLQTRNHFLKCEQNPAKCDRSDLGDATSKAIALARHWSGRITTLQNLKLSGTREWLTWYDDDSEWPCFSVSLYLSLVSFSLRVQRVSGWRPQTRTIHVLTLYGRQRVPTIVQSMC